MCVACRGAPLIPLLSWLTPPLPHRPAGQPQRVVGARKDCGGAAPPRRLLEGEREQSAECLDVTAMVVRYPGAGGCRGAALLNCLLDGDLVCWEARLVGSRVYAVGFRARPATCRCRAQRHAAAGPSGMLSLLVPHTLHVPCPPPLCRRRRARPATCCSWTLLWTATSACWWSAWTRGPCRVRGESCHMRRSAVECCGAGTRLNATATPLPSMLCA